MGLIDFVKDAGEKLFGWITPDEAAKPEAAVKKSTSLSDFVLGLGLPVTNLSITMEGDTAVVRGEVADQATRERVVLAIGNTAGIARVDDQLTVSRPEPEAVYYTVVRGDTLSGIAKKHYGNAMKYPVIFEANKPMLKDPDKIYPGQVLRIPGIGS